MNLLRESGGALKVVYDPVDLSFLREARRAKVEGNKDVAAEASALEQAEWSIMERSDAVVAVSTYEQELVRRRLPGKPCVLLQSVYPVVAPVKDFAERKGLLFLGGFDHPPNVDAMLWFVHEVLPLIQRMLPGVIFEIVGSNPPAAVQRLASSSVRVTGYVPDVTPYFEARRLFVAPLRYGAGEKGKIAHSLSHGVPVVTTSIGAEGMQMIDEDHTLIGDTAEEFAEKVCTLYTDSNLWERLSRAGLTHAIEFHSRETMLERIRVLFRTLGVLGGTTAAHHPRAAPRAV